LIFSKKKLIILQELTDVPLWKFYNFITLFLNLSKSNFHRIHCISLRRLNHTVAQMNCFLNGEPSNRKTMQVHSPRTRFTGLANISVNSIRVMYKQSRQLANVKIHVILNIPDFPLSVYSLPKFRVLPRNKPGFISPASHLQPQYLKTNSGIVSLTRPHPHPSRSFPIHHSHIQPFDAT
jgi:hypothetical protein